MEKKTIGKPESDSEWGVVTFDTEWACWNDVSILVKDQIPKYFFKRHEYSLETHQGSSLYPLSFAGMTVTYPQYLRLKILQGSKCHPLSLSPFLETYNSLAG